MIHPDCPGLEMTVCVDGIPLIEYDTENDEINPEEKLHPKAVRHQRECTHTKYIESTTGKSFTVNLSAKSPYRLNCPNVEFEVIVDGNWVQSPLMGEVEYAGKKWAYVVQGVLKDAGAVLCPMIFAEIQSTSERLSKSEVREQGIDMAYVGKIEVRVYRNTADKVSQGTESEYYETDYSKMISEKALAKESKSHGTILGKARPVEEDEKDEVCETEYMDGEDYPICIYVFKYRSKTALRSLRVLQEPVEPEEPRAETVETTSDAALSFNIDNLGLSPAQKVQVLAVLEQQKKKAIKRELPDDDESDQPRKKPKKMIGKVIIDLTEDEPESIELD